MVFAAVEKPYPARAKALRPVRSLRCFNSCLAFSIILRARHRLESPLINRLATTFALPIGAIFNSEQGVIDFLDQLHLASAEIKGGRPIKIQLRHLADIYD